MSPNQSFDSSAYFNLDPSQAAKQMAALSAASQARIAANSRAPSVSLPSGGGTSSGSYLGGITPHNYPAGSNDLLPGSHNGHANIQLTSTHVQQGPNSAVNSSFLDQSMSQLNFARNPSQSFKHRQQQFLHGLANVMAKRGTPLPPSLTGVVTPGYDPATSTWSIIEPSSEVGSFRLAGKDVDLFRLWGLVFQQGGGQALTSTNGWSAILPQFDLPETFPQPQPNGSTSVALTLAQHYMYILYPFEESYRRNVQDSQKKAQMMSTSRPGMSHQQQMPTGTGPGRGPQGLQNSTQAGISGQTQRSSMGNTMALMGQSPSAALGPLSGVNGSSPYNQALQAAQTPPQRPSMLNQLSSHSTLPDSMSNSQRGIPNLADTNLLDQDIQGIKRKLDMDDGENKRARQKTEQLDMSSTIGTHLDSPPGTSQSQLLNVVSTPTRPRSQLSRRKIEYVPLAREVDTYGGRDLRLIENELANLSSRRSMRDINDWGTIDIEALTMSIRSRLSTELSYALSVFALLSTMRGQTPGSGFPIFQCGDLLDEVLDLVEDEAFDGLEDTGDRDSLDCDGRITTNRELVNLVYEEESHPFAQNSKVPLEGVRQRPADLIISVLNIIRNLSIISDNIEYLARNERLVDTILRLCSIKQAQGPPTPASSALSLKDLIVIRKDVLYTLTAIGGLIQLNSSKVSIRIAKRTFELVSSYLVDPIDAVSPVASVQVAGVPLSSSVKPPGLTDVALEVFTRFSQSDSNRQIIANSVSQGSLWCLFESLIHRLPLVDADFHIIRGDYWLSYLEKVIMAIYSLAFLAPPDMKQRVKTDRKLGFKGIMLRMIQRFIVNPSRESRNWFFVCTKRAIETMKVLDDGADSFDTSESPTPIMSFGMGFGEMGDAGSERGIGMLGGHRDLTWSMLMVQEVQEDAVMFAELESLARVECQ